MRDVPVDGFLAPELRGASSIDAPLPTAIVHSAVMLPAPRYLALLLQMLELASGVSVLLLGAVGGYVESLLARLVEPGTVTVWEEDERVASAAGIALDAHGFQGRVRFVSSPPPNASYDRVTTTDAIQRLSPEAKAAIGDAGFAVFRRYTEAFGLVKILRSGDEYVEISTGEMAVPTQAGVDIGRELLIARMLENVWRERPETGPERQFLAVVDDTFPAQGSRPPMSADDAARYEGAKRLFHLAYVYQAAGDWDASIDAYAGSIAVRPTAEAHTFLGWVYSFQDRHEEAIAECEKAIAVDPSFGNPYNDIGAYLIELDRLDESIPWFEKAKKAQRYCCYFYAYSNLGRVYMMKGMPKKARREFEEALRINPQYEYAREMLERLDRGSGYVA